MIVVAAVVALAVTVLLLPPLIGWLRRVDVLDQPSARSSHRIPTPRGGGAAVVVAVLLAVLLAGGRTTASLAGVGPALVVLVGMGVLGWCEDLRGVAPMRRLAGQAGIATAGAAAAALAGWPGWVVALVPVAVVVYANAFNFMDGVNAISSVNAMFAGVTYAVLGASHGTGWIVLVGVAVAAASAGFLPYNAPVARVFLGDSGSYALGGVLAMLGLGCAAAGASPLLCATPMTVYLADTGTTLLDRIRRRQPWRAAHRDHAYQAIADLPLGHLGAAALTVVVAAATTGLAVLIDQNQSARWLAAVTAVALVLGYLGTPRLLRPPRLGTPALPRHPVLVDRPAEASR